MNSFKDAQIIEYDDKTVICYRSSYSVFEEALFKGVPVACGYNAAGYPLNVLSNCDTRIDPKNFSEPMCFNIEADSSDICRRMKLTSFKKDESDSSFYCVAEFESGIMPVTVEEHTVLDGTAIMTRHLEIENNGNKSINISRLVIHGGAIESFNISNFCFKERVNPENIYEIGYFRNDEWAREGELDFSALKPGITSVTTRFEADRFRHPAVFLKNKLTGVYYFIQAGYSGGVKFTFNLDAKNSSDNVRLSYTAQITGYFPLYQLKNGEKLITPEIHFGVIHGDFDKAVNENIKHIRKSVLTASPVLEVGAGMGAEHDMSVETALLFAKQMCEMGAEVFIIDAGWACPPGKEMHWGEYNGINREDRDRYPDGLRQIREYCKSIGMKFALWLEPERVGKFSAVR
ncbi:MAG: alpha-galactosidase, partial [Clostridiales bacterium]|nr:alpha-galactosidase [Clostridiales bacterium]